MRYFKLLAHAVILRNKNERDEFLRVTNLAEE